MSEGNHHQVNGVETADPITQDGYEQRQDIGSAGSFHQPPHMVSHIDDHQNEGKSFFVARKERLE